MKKAKEAFRTDESGVVAVIVAIGLLVLIGIAALALDIAHLVDVKRDLQKAADAGALAGARGLWPAILPAVSGSRTPDCGNAQNRALSTAMENQVDGTDLAASEVTVQVGRWDYTTRQFIPGNTSSANAVKVVTQRNGVRMSFAEIFGTCSENLTASAIAVMDYAKAVGKGTLPIAVNKDYTDPNTTLFINFTPDPLDNGGWFTDPPDSASANTFKSYIDNAVCAPLNIGDIINLQNGNDTSVLQDLQDKLAQHPGGWDVLLPVVDTDQFNQSQPITGFVPFRITAVDSNCSPKGVHGTVLSAAEMQDALPGGSSYGGLAPPKLVQ
jgi:Flp pilus assembly protein TadG